MMITVSSFKEKKSQLVFLPFGAGHVAYFYLSAMAANEVDENGGESEPKQ